MEKRVTTGGFRWGRILGGSLLLIIIGLSIFLAHVRVQALRTHFEAAIESVTRLGMLSQAMLHVAEKMAAAEDEAIFFRKQAELRSLIRQMETVHLSLANGTPEFEADPRLGKITRSEYKEGEKPVSVAIEDYLAHARLLAGTSPQKTSLAFQENLRYLDIAVNKELPRELGNLISRYKSELNARILEVWAILVGGLMLLMMFAVPLVIFLLVRNRALTAPPSPKKEAAPSVATVLQPLSINDHSGALVVQALLPENERLSPVPALPAPSGYSGSKRVAAPGTGFYLNIRRKKTGAPVPNDVESP